MALVACPAQCIKAATTPLSGFLICESSASTGMGKTCGWGMGTMPMGMCGNRDNYTGMGWGWGSKFILVSIFILVLMLNDLLYSSECRHCMK